MNILRNNEIPGLEVIEHFERRDLVLVDLLLTDTDFSTLQELKPVYPMGLKKEG